MKQLYLITTFLAFFLVNSAFAQPQKKEYTLGKERDFNVTEGTFYDNGGKEGNLINEYFITTLHSYDEVTVFFEELAIPIGSRLNFYLGKNTSGKLVGSISHYDKISNITGKEITIEYLPSKASDNIPSNFKGQIKRTSNSGNHRASRSQPESDCPYAISLCQNQTAVALAGQYTDVGSVSDDAGGCYSGTGNGGSVWYSFQPQANGPLDFTITPTGSTDYDFVVWDITSGCASGQRQEVSCNYSVITGATGLSSTLCSQSGGSCSPNDCSTDSKGSDCNKFNRTPNVLASHKYAVCINFYSGSNDGFNIQFKNEASSVNISDATPPTILTATANSCPTASQFKLRFSEFVDCSTLQGTDLTLAGHTVTLTSTNCANGVTNAVDVTISPALTTGTYSLHGQDISDLCGNNMNSNFSIVIGSSPTPTISPTKTTCKSPGLLGIGYSYSPSSQSLTAGGGTFYQWSDGQNAATIAVAPTTTTTYTVTITQGACPATASVTVNVETSPVVNIPDQDFCAGQSRTLSATGGGTYQWYTGPNLLGNGTAIPAPTGTAASLIASPTATTTYRVIVTSPNGCKGQDDVTLNLVSTNCCNASITPVSLCANDLPVTLVVGTTGGTFSGPGITNTATGVFDPVVAGIGNHKIFYQLACGKDSAIMTVTGCSAVHVCKETNGNLTASGGTPTFTWSYWKAASSTPITNSATCTACGGNWTPFVNICTSGITTITSCPVAAGWVQFATGTTVTPPAGKDTIKVIDNVGTTVTMYGLASVPLCASCPTITVNTTPTNTSCGLSNGSATTTVSGGVAPYTYTWSNSAGSASGISGKTAGTYTVTVKDANLCSATASVTIGTSPALTATSTIYNTSCGKPNGSIKITPSGGNGTYTYQWSANTTATTDSATNLANGLFSVTITSGTGCSIVKSGLFVQPSYGPNDSLLSVVDETCAGQNDGKITVQGTASTLFTMYLSTYPIFTDSVSYGTNSVYINLAPKTYIITIRDINNCWDTVVATVKPGVNCCNLAFQTITKTNPSCGLNNGSIALTMSGGSATKTYSWSANAATGNSATATNLGAGTYTVTITSGICQKDTTFTLVNTIPPTVNAGVDTSLNCVRTSVGLLATSSTAGATFAWSNAVNTASNSVSSPNTYTVTATNPANGCTASDVVVVSQNITLPNVSVIPTTGTITCATTSIPLTASSTTGGVTYNWGGGNTTTSLNVTTAGTYTVTVTNPSNGCTSTRSVNIGSNTTAPGLSVAKSGSNLTCVLTGIVLTASSPVSGVAYDWGGGNTTNTFNVSTSGVYTVTITDPNNGCINAQSTFISTNYLLPNVSVTPTTGTITCTTTSIPLVASSSTAGTTYLWSNGVNTASNTVSSANTYTVTATNPANGCTASNAVIITQNTTAPNVNAGLDTSLNCVRISVGLLATSSTSGATFAWSNAVNTASNAVSSPNTYTITATNPANGCTASDAVIVTQNTPAPNINAGIDTSLNCVRTSVGLLATSSTAGATFAWSNAVNTASNAVSSPNTYTVTATNPANGCTSSDVVVVSQNIAIPNVSVLPTTGTITCATTSIPLTASSTTGGVTYNWGGGNTTTSLNTTTAGTYTVTVTNPSNGCTSTRSVNIGSNTTAPGLSVTKSGSTLTCTITSIVLSASSPVSGVVYDWGGGNTTNTFNVTTSGVYTVTITDPSNGCKNAQSTLISSNSILPNVSVTPTTGAITCTTTSIPLVANSSTAGATYLWSNGINTASNTVTSANTYSVTVTNPLNGCTASDTVNVTQNTTAPNVNAGADTSLNCVRTSVGLLATSSTTGATFAWSNAVNTAANTVSSPNTYTVTASNPANGCTASDVVVVTQNTTTPNVNAGIDTSLNCVKTSVGLLATSSTTSATFAWSNVVNTASNTVSLPNTYTVTVTNPVNGCTASDAVVVTQNITAPNVNAGVDTSLNCVRTSVGLLATSSTTGAIFAWSNAVNTANNSVSSPNTYTVTATNPANGCTASDAVVVTQNITLPNANAGVDTSLNCVRTSVGLLATSSTTGATFAWSNALSTATNTVSSPNTYTVTVTNPANGCTASDAVVVTQNITPSNVNAGVDQVLSCASSSATLSGSSTVSGASYLWSGTGIVSGGNTAIAIVNIAGNYSLMVTDPSNGCTAIDIVNVSPNVNTPNINAGLDQQLTCAITSVTLIATSSTTGATFAWSNAINTASNTVNFPNTYTVTVTDPNNGCMAVDQVLVTQNTTTPNINAGLDTVLTCSRTSLNLLATSSTTGVTYTWSNGPTNANNLVNTANTYTVTALDPSNGCTASDGVVVSQDVTLPNINAGQDTALTCSITNISLQANSTTSPVSYLWSNSTIGSTNTVSMAGTYTVTATNLQNGCSASDAVIVALNITTPNVDAGANQTLSCTKTNATLTGSSTTTAVVYLWSGPGIVSGANTVSATVNQTGTYTLQVTDPSNGCTASDFVNVNPNVNAPNVNAGPDQTLTCAITSTALSATSTTPGVTFLWSNAATTPTTSVNSIGTYSVTVTDPNNGCQATDQVTVNQDISAPIVNAGIDATLTCVISSVQLQASSPVAGVTFVWSNGATSASTTVSAADAYSVTATNPSNGCSASDTVLVDANGVPSLAISSGDNPCPDVAKGFIQTNVTGGVSPYNYSWSNGSNTSSLSQLHGGIYTVTITDANGCSVSQTVSLVEGDSLTILNLDNIILNLGETIQLNPLVTGSTAPLSYTWNPPLYLSCSNCSNPIVNTVGNITYTLYVIDTNGCSSEGMISIHVTPDYQIYVPNAFTPNSDGTNDVFEIYGNKKLWKELNVRIFNRWGEKVFESSDSKFAWDGTFHGVLQNPQVYVYELRITFINGYAMPLQKGSITLIR